MALSALGCAMILVCAVAAAAPAALQFKEGYNRGDRFTILSSWSMSIKLKLSGEGNMSLHQRDEQRSQVKCTVTAVEVAGGVPVVERITFDESSGDVLVRPGADAEIKKLKCAGASVMLRRMGDGSISHSLSMADLDTQRYLRGFAERDRVHYPAGAVSVGQRWEMNPRVLDALNLGNNARISGFCTLKSIKQVQGRAVAEIAIAAAAVTKRGTLNLELQVEGSAQIDQESGQLVRLDLSGPVWATGHSQLKLAGRATTAKAAGEGKVEIHQLVQAQRSRTTTVPATPLIPAVKPSQVSEQAVQAGSADEAAEDEAGEFEVILFDARKIGA